MAIGVINFYKVELVQRIVVRSIIQKAPAEFPVERIKRSFRLAKENILNDQEEQKYIEYMLSLSQRLEKVQFLTEIQIEKIINEL